MKKVYKKPEVLIESFELSQHIASCQHPIKNKTSEIQAGCTADVPEIGVTTLFYIPDPNDTSSSSSCKTDGSDMFCKTNGGNDTFVFSS